jgi:SAM-dependent methyltransferase
MMKIRTKLELTCTVDDAWSALDDPTVFQKVSKPFLVFTPISPAVFPDRYLSGESYQVEARAFGLMSLGRQEINPVMTTAGLERTFVDNGRGLSGPLGVMKHFHHTMTLRPSGRGPTLLTDELEWDAGILSPLFWVGFRFFWWWRHRMMLKLVPSWQNDQTATWEKRYSGQEMWSGVVNPTLEKIVSGLSASGAALDVGCGSGADALWLAEQSFDVTAVDASPTALSRAEEERVRRITTDHRPRIISWIAHNVSRDSLPERPGGYQVVTSHFFHTDAAERKNVWKKLVAATAPGGTLIIVGHSPEDAKTGVRRPPVHLMFDEKELAAAIPSSWSKVAVSQRPRTQTLAGGASAEVHDIVLVATH